MGLAIACCYFYVSTKQFSAKKYGLSFWLVVALPLVATYTLRERRSPIISYDVLNYHLLQTERTLRGPLFGPGDYFPSLMPFNPAADTLAGISRLFLGFRLGTIFNLVALVCAAQISDKLLRPFIKNSWLRSASVLLIVLSGEFTFEISAYMVDLLTLPLLLEATSPHLARGRSQKSTGQPYSRGSATWRQRSVQTYEPRGRVTAHCDVCLQDGSDSRHFRSLISSSF